MKKPSVFAVALLAVLACAPTYAEAAGKSSQTSSSKSSKDAKAELPANPKFVEYQNGDTWTMRIEGLGKRGDDEGYIQYDKYDYENAKLITNVSVKGMVHVKGVGEALKKRLLEQYKEATFESDLIKSNREKLLTAWSKSYPSAPSSDELRKEVPALATKFGNDFDFEIKAFPSKSGGSIHLWVKPNGSGKVTGLNPDALDKMVLDDPQFRPASAKKDDAKKEAEEKKKDDAKQAEADKKKSGSSSSKTKKKH